MFLHTTPQVSFLGVKTLEELGALLSIKRHISVYSIFCIEIIFSKLRSVCVCDMAPVFIVWSDYKVELASVVVIVTHYPTWQLQCCATSPLTITSSKLGSNRLKVNPLVLIHSSIHIFL